MLGGIINQAVNGSSARRESEDGSVCGGSWPVSNDVSNVVVRFLNSLIESLNSSMVFSYIISNSSNVGINIRNRVARGIVISHDEDDVLCCRRL